MTTSSRPLPLVQLLLCGALVVTLSMGIRHAFGLWLQPITQAHGWSREHFSLALALQNLVWGAAGPVCGLVGRPKRCIQSTVGRRHPVCTGPVRHGNHHGAPPLLVDHGRDHRSGASRLLHHYSVYGIIGRNISAQQRSWAMGITAAAGSFGQFLMVPLTALSCTGWTGLPRSGIGAVGLADWPHRIRLAGPSGCSPNRQPRTPIRLGGPARCLGAHRGFCS